MKRVPGIGLPGLALVGLAVALAVLVQPRGGVTPAGAQPQPPLSPHHECFVLPEPPLQSNVVNLETQFGLEQNVQVGPGHYLCPPALKNGEGDLTAPHLRCFDIDGPAPGVYVELQTQFGFVHKVPVGRAKLLCTPTTKIVVGQPAPTPTPLDTPHYKCYEITGDDPTAEVGLETQFGLTQGVAVGQAKYLCLPAIKTRLPGGQPEGNLNEPHLKCYSIVAPPPNPPIAVEVQTQFGIEQAEPVGPAELLCVPALKVVIPGVGGVAELPGSAGGAPEESAAPTDSGWSTGAYAGLVAGVAAVLMALGGAAWYARRRWLR